MKSISEWLRMSKLAGFDVVVTDKVPETEVHLVQGGKIVGKVVDVGSDESVKCKTCGSSGFGFSILGPDHCTLCDGTEGGSPPPLPHPWSAEAPIEHQWYWVTDYETAWLAMHLKSAAGGWSNGDTWEDYSHEVRAWVHLPVPKVPGRQ